MPMKSKPVSAPLQDDLDNAWPDDVKAKYQRAGVQLVLGGRVTQKREGHGKTVARVRVL
jgi:hypothetical protein